MLLLLAVLLIGLVHWLVAVWGWRFQFHSLRAYLDSWWPPGDQRRVLATWPAAALEAGVVRKGAGKKVAILSPDGVHIQPRGVTLTFTTPADSSLHATLQRAAPGLAGHYGRPVDVRHHEGIAHVTVAYRDPLAVARQASNRSHGRH